ncbi:hypothetical protein D3C87_1449400 [compost metagenome]
MVTRVVEMVRERWLSISSLRLLSCHSSWRLAFSMAVAEREARLVTTSRSWSPYPPRSMGRSMYTAPTTALRILSGTHRAVRASSPGSDEPKRSSALTSRR